MTSQSSTHALTYESADRSLEIGLGFGGAIDYNRAIRCTERRSMNLTMLVKQLDSGQVEASVLEFPGYRIKAASRDIAIDRLRSTLIDRFQGMEVLPFEIPFEIPVSLESPWNKLFGLFKDDPYFDDVMEIIQTERDALGDEEIDSAYYS